VGAIASNRQAYGQAFRAQDWRSKQGRHIDAAHPARRQRLVGQDNLPSRKESDEVFGQSEGGFPSRWEEFHFPNISDVLHSGSRVLFSKDRRG
jgi:hypothetical protein